MGRPLAGGAGTRAAPEDTARPAGWEGRDPAGSEPGRGTADPGVGGGGTRPRGSPARKRTAGAPLGPRSLCHSKQDFGGHRGAATVRARREPPAPRRSQCAARAAPTRRGGPAGRRDCAPREDRESEARPGRAAALPSPRRRRCAPRAAGSPGSRGSPEGRWSTRSGPCSPPGPPHPLARAAALGRLGSAGWPAAPPGGGREGAASGSPGECAGPSVPWDVQVRLERPLAVVPPMAGGVVHPVLCPAEAGTQSLPGTLVESRRSLDLLVYYSCIPNEYLWPKLFLHSCNGNRGS